MIIFASEDVGNADPAALQLAVAVKDAFHFVGMPEGWIPLAQGVAYLACAPKSNASYMAYLEALKDVREKGALAVPSHIRNAPTPMMKDMGYGKGYKYPIALVVMPNRYTCQKSFKVRNTISQQTMGLTK